ncbi:MAG: hypothetical protein ACXV7G_09555 [Halobacteriota archaeon]
MAFSVLILVIAATTVAGCTGPADPGPIASSQPSTTPTATPTTTPTTKPTATPSKSTSKPAASKSGSTNEEVAYASKLTTYFKDKFDEKDATVVKPFALDATLSKPGMPAYTAEVKDGSAKLQMWTHKLTYIFYNDRQSARSGFEQAKAKATTQGYGNPVKGDNYWTGIIGTWSEAVGTKEAAVNVCQPGNLCGDDFWLTFSDDFVVALDYKTRVE